MEAAVCHRTREGQVAGMSSTSRDWGPIYLEHREVMHRVAASVLREVGLADQAGDAVQEAMASLVGAPPPEDVRDWEAFMVTVAKRKALDFVRSAAVRHAGPELTDEHDRADDDDPYDTVEDAIDRSRQAGHVWDSLAVLDSRHRMVIREYVAHERPRSEVAAELGVTPARVSQMTREALEKLRAELEGKESSE